MNDLLNNDQTSKDSEVKDDENDAEDEALAEILREYESDDSIGVGLQSVQLAKLVDKMFRKRLPEKTLKEKMDKQERPGNCENARATRVNPGIWRKLREFTRKRDLNVFKIQQALVKGIVPVIRITDMAMTANGSLDKDQLQDIKRMGLDALSLLAHSNYELNMMMMMIMDLYSALFHMYNMFKGALQ